MYRSNAASYHSRWRSMPSTMDSPGASTSGRCPAVTTWSGQPGPAWLSSGPRADEANATACSLRSTCRIAPSSALRSTGSTSTSTSSAFCAGATTWPPRSAGRVIARRSAAVDRETASSELR
ncbi:hypothetical protein ADL03_34790 [Nocardia sp. NRRL S-836]|nr:hypothetical protein ADL03_34790 [Nocardia sp. NRRL S-836]